MPATPRMRGNHVAWMASFLLHATSLIVFSFLAPAVMQHQPPLMLTAPSPAEPVVVTPLPTRFQYDPIEQEEIGASAMGGPHEGAVAAQIVLPDVRQVPALQLEPQVTGLLEAREFIEATSAPEVDLNQAIKGAAGVAVTGAEGAVDRITQEILLSLEDRQTLVVWFFDRSGSLQSQRQAILKRFRRIYQELGVIQASGDDAFTRHADDPLLTSVVSFGADVQFLTDKPTANLQQIEAAVASIELDDSGVEQVFTAIHAAAMRYRKQRTEGGRHVMFVAFTDEAGDDQEGLDPTVDLCRRFAIPVYVVGVPAPFGRRETLVKWVDPDPSFDQTPDWGRVDQGPESLALERIQVALSGFRDDETPIDSGFGPFALTRLCYETGGIYFTVHPNRKTDRRISRRETQTYAAYFSAFFDPEVMRRYRPEYVSAAEYRQRVSASPLRSALVRASESSWLETLDNPPQRFVVRSEAAFVNELTEAQKVAARLEPAFAQLCQVLREGEAARPAEITPRWQAGYDLAMGRALACKVRTEGYNSMLAKAKRGMKFSEGKNNTWQLQPADEIAGGSRLEREGAQAREYLTRVAREHPGTPWALLAEREMEQPLGWQWHEDHTPMEPPSNQVADNNNNNPNSAAQNERPVVLPPPVKKRPPPKL